MSASRRSRTPNGPERRRRRSVRFRENAGSFCILRSRRCGIPVGARNTAFPNASTRSSQKKKPRRRRRWELTYLILRAIHHRRFRDAFAHFTQVGPLMSPRQLVFVVNLPIARFTQVRVVVVTVYRGVRGAAQHARNHLCNSIGTRFLEPVPRLEPRSPRSWVSEPDTRSSRTRSSAPPAKDTRGAFYVSRGIGLRERARRARSTPISTRNAPLATPRLSARARTRATPSPGPGSRQVSAAPDEVRDEKKTRIHGKTTWKVYPFWRSTALGFSFHTVRVLVTVRTVTFCAEWGCLWTFENPTGHHRLEKSHPLSRALVRLRASGKKNSKVCIFSQTNVVIGVLRRIPAPTGAERGGDDALILFKKVRNTEFLISGFLDFWISEFLVSSSVVRA